MVLYSDVRIYNICPERSPIAGEDEAMAFNANLVSSNFQPYFWSYPDFWSDAMEWGYLIILAVGRDGLKPTKTIVGY